MKQDNLTSTLFLIVLFLIGFTPFFSHADSRMKLNRDWQFRELGTDHWLQASVPGCVHTDLLANRLIADPFWGTNEEKLQWIEERDWEYKTDFTVDEDLWRNDRHELVFEGLDTYCHVFLNGELILRADNMFRRWQVDCDGLLKKGQNRLLVKCYSPVKKAGTTKERLGYKLPGGPRVLTRKAAYHFGWDWGPRLVTGGIWRPVYVIGWQQARFRDVYVRQDQVELNEARVTVQCEVESLVARRAKLLVQWISPRKKKYEFFEDIKLKPGVQTVDTKVAIPQPELWWTNGLGEAHRYDVTVRLAMDGQPLAKRSLKVGLRSLKLVQSKDSKGTGFYFLLNGIQVFAKGANIIPLDSFVPRVDRKRYARLLEDAAAVGMNMLRVWGGGIYQNDLFYDLCDRLGIMVWQDFMFANGMYPGDGAFLENVRLEAIDNIKRLRNHPSIALWCGNNEMDEAWHNWGWRTFDNYTEGQREKIRRDYLKLFHELLPQLVTVHDCMRQYWPSSPQFGRADPRSLTEGDAHYWGVWHDGEPFENFMVKVGRFMSEYGFQSFPEKKTIEGFAGPGELNVDSPVMRAHQKHPRGNSLIQTYMKQYYPPARDFFSFVFLSQVLQAEGIKVALEAHRRARPYCMGTLYWQLNDCWPVASWSSIDYYGRWKALHYYVKQAYRPFLVSPVKRDGNVELTVVSDQVNPSTGVLEMTLLDFAGKRLWKKEVNVMIPPGSSTCFFSIPEKRLLKDLDPRSVVLAALVTVGPERVASNLMYFQPPKELLLPKPRLDIQVSISGYEYSVVVSTDKLARNVYLEAIGVEGRFSDNYFDLLPGVEKRIRFIPAETFKSQQIKTKVTSLVDYIER
jgi:beta-mannosidase